MRVGLTDRFCQGAKPLGGSRVDYFDDDERTRGLALRVAASGRKAWAFLFTSPKDGKRARLTFGTYPAVSLADARARALEALGCLNESPPRDPRDVARDRDAGAMTVKTLVPLYLEKPHRKTGQPRRSVGEIKRRLEKNVTPIIGDVRLADLHRRDVTRVIAAITKRKKRVEAARVFEDVRAMVRWAVGQGYLDSNPMEGMERPSTTQARERTLSDAEIRDVWNGLAKSLARSKTCQRIIKLCLVTAQRVGEVAGMERSELDLKARLWTLPGRRTKNGEEHKVPLSPLAIELIKDALESGGPKYVFPNPEGDGSLPPAAVARTIVRAHEGDEERPNGRFQIEHWTAHDLRRTAVTNMAKLGVAPIVLAHVVNHISITKATVLAKHYDRYDYAKEKRAALDLWGERIGAVVEGRAIAEVVQLHATA